MTAFWTLFLILVIAFSLIAAHQSGHYLAGMIAGIPARDMRVVLLAFPQHVQGVRPNWKCVRERELLERSGILHGRPFLGGRSETDHAIE